MAWDRRCQVGMVHNRQRLCPQAAPCSVEIAAATPELRLDKELYEKILRRLQELRIEQDRPPKVHIAVQAEVRGMVDNRGQWTLIMLGATILLGVLLLTVRLAVRPQPRASDRP